MGILKKIRNMAKTKLYKKAKNKLNSVKAKEPINDNNISESVEKELINELEATQEIHEKAENEQVENNQANDQTLDENNANQTQEEEPMEVRLERELSEMKDKYLRLSAEFDNYRKRTLKERMEMLKTASEDVLVNLLQVVDNFERALKTMESSQDVAAIKEGIELIYKNFTSFLAQRGMKEIEAIGLEFDTDLHEAITKIPAPSDELKGKVVDVIEKGYKLHDKISRYAKVVIGE
jgi:molecular chaperone GrpE